MAPEQWLAPKLCIGHWCMLYQSFSTPNMYRSVNDCVGARCRNDLNHLGLFATSWHFDIFSQMTAPNIAVYLFVVTMVMIVLLSFTCSYLLLPCMWPPMWSLYYFHMALTTLATEWFRYCSQHAQEVSHIPRFPICIPHSTSCLMYNTKSCMQEIHSSQGGSCMHFYITVELNMIAQYLQCDPYPQKAVVFGSLLSQGHSICQQYFWCGMYCSQITGNSCGMCGHAISRRLELKKNSHEHDLKWTHKHFSICPQSFNN